MINHWKVNMLHFRLGTPGSPLWLRDYSEEVYKEILLVSMLVKIKFVRVRTWTRMQSQPRSQPTTRRVLKPAWILQMWQENRTGKFLVRLRGLRTQLVSMRMQVWSLASLSGLRIRHCCELWSRSQTQLGSQVAVTVTKASSCSSDLTPSLETSICHQRSLKETKKKKKKKRTELSYSYISWSLDTGCPKKEAWPWARRHRTVKGNFQEDCNLRTSSTHEARAVAFSRFLIPSNGSHKEVKGQI